MRANLRKNIKRVSAEALSISSATTSSQIDLEGRTLCGINVTALTTAASCTITVSPTDGGTFNTLGDKDGTDFTITLTDDKYIYIDPAVFAGVEFFKIVLNASGSLTADLHFRNME